jgi:hypothetical protein
MCIALAMVLLAFTELDVGIQPQTFYSGCFEDVEIPLRTMPMPVSALKPLDSDLPTSTLRHPLLHQFLGQTLVVVCGRSDAEVCVVV